MGDRTGIFTEMITIHGSAIVAFHDLRDAMRCLRHLRNDHFFPNRKLETHFVSNITLQEVKPHKRNPPLLNHTLHYPLTSHEDDGTDSRWRLRVTRSRSMDFLVGR